VVKKTLPNAFAGTDLAERIAAAGRGKLVVIGFMTHMCVDATTRSALDHGLATTVVAAACASRDLPTRSAARGRRPRCIARRSPPWPIASPPWSRMGPVSRTDGYPAARAAIRPAPNREDAMARPCMSIPPPR